MSPKKKSSTGRLVLMRRFMLNRTEDPSGTSGTGVVAEGVRFSNGKCAMTWVVGRTSVVVYDTLEDLVAVHGHNGSSQVEWID